MDTNTNLAHVHHVRWRWHQRKLMRQDAARAGITYWQAHELKRMYISDSHYNKVIRLLSRKKPTRFQKSLQKQTREWLTSTDKRYPLPLSSKQMGYI